ncbi:MAG: C39 family peptidase [Chloroflexi bacterium]|nr:C39 family peptidase [Chloroflexota bacterium]
MLLEPHRKSRSRRRWRWLLAGLIGLIGLLLAALVVYRIPAVNNRLYWRLEILKGAVLRALHPGDTVPAAQASAPDETPLASPVPLDDTTAREGAALPVTPPAPTPPPREATSGSPLPSLTPPYTLVDPPEAVTLKSPKWEKQGWNNCGPTTLSMDLRYWGWPGNQEDVAGVLKPSRLDKNVRWDELVYYVKTQAGWLDATFRVGGTVELVKTFVANGYPVILEKGFVIEEGNTGWTGHYNLVTGYDDRAGVWIAQDSWKGANQIVPYADMNADWQAFNYLFILVYPAGDKDKIAYMLGDYADEAGSRRRALEISERETQDDPDNAFAWMNLGNNLTYFNRFAPAAPAFDRARAIGLPYRILWYQFSPYRAYYNLRRYQEVVDLTTATLEKADNLEENYFWRGWARLSLGDRAGAIGDFRNALNFNPNYLDAQNALATLGVKP